MYEDYVETATLASYQHGVVTREQLRRIGVKDSSIPRMSSVPEGLLSMRRGVYVISFLQDTAWDDEQIAYQAAEPKLFSSEKNTNENALKNVVFSHYSAARLHGRGDLPMELHMRSAKRCRVDGIYFHSMKGLTADDITWIDDLPVTSLEQTTRDLGQIHMDGEHRSRWMLHLYENEGWSLEKIADLLGPQAMEESFPYFEMKAA